MKTWLITGCSSGIGKGIAKAVLESGDQAIVTARNKDKVMDIVEAYPETALAVSLDVCSQDSIKNAVKELIHFGEDTYPSVSMSVLVPPSNLLSA